MTLSLLLHFPEYIIRDFWILNARFGPLYQTSWLLIPFSLVKVCNARHPMMHIGSSCHGQALNLAQVGCTILPLFFVKKHELVFWMDGLDAMISYYLKKFGQGGFDLTFEICTKGVFFTCIFCTKYYKVA